jgi:predicted PurR-regulated permease PerM
MEKQIPIPNILVLSLFFLGLTYCFWSLGVILVPFLIGVIGSYLLNPVVERARKIGIGRGLSSFLIVTTLLVGFIAIILIALPFIQKELIFIAKVIPSLIDKAGKWIQNKAFIIFGKSLRIEDFTNISKQLSNQFSSLLNWFVKIFLNVIDTGVILANVVLVVVLTPILTFYILNDWDKICKTVLNYLPIRYRSVILNELSSIDCSLKIYVKGLVKVCLIISVLYALSLWAIGLNGGWLIGILTGMLYIIPYIGMMIGFFISLAVALHQGVNLLSVLCVFIIIPMIDVNFITPKLIGNKIGIHSVWIIFSLLAGGAWFGFWGVLLALPGAIILRVFLRFFMVWYKKIYIHQGCSPLNITT